MVHLQALALTALMAVLPATLAGDDSPPIVYTAALDGIIHPVTAEFMMGAMDRADRARAALLVFTLETPGGLVDSTRAIVSRMLRASTPVVVFVAPAGARAASAGFILTIAADVAAMAPATHIGAAHPVSGSGTTLDDTSAKKAEEDVAAYVRSLASGRGRNVMLSGQAVTESKAFTEREAREASPPLVDLIASDLSDLLRQMDGRSVRRFDGTTTVVHTAGATMVPVEMTWRQKVLSLIARPDVAYGLLSLGMLGLTIELWNPGAILPGVVGGVSLLLASFALQLLPVNYAGLGLTLFGLLLLVLELKVTSYGLLAVGGLVSLVFGSLMLMDSPSPEMRVSLSVIFPMVAGFVAVTGLLIRLAVTAQRQAPVTGSAGMIGQVGEAVTTLEPGAVGQIHVHGELWRARASDAIPPGGRVRVLQIDGLTLTVAKE
jgi:membrane-bound serine protease (ClpP class)